MILYKIYRHLVNIPYAIYNRLSFRRKHIAWPEGLHVWGGLRLFGQGIVHIGKDVTIVSCIDANPTGGSFSAFVTYPGSVLKIGDHVGISNSTFNVRKSIEIGANTLIGANCLVADNDFHPISWKDRLEDQLGNIKCQPIKVGDNVFIGARCIILKGVSIGARSVIGAGSVVTRNVPQDEVWAGNPAHFVKKIES